jgi:preprotein translocase subunit SecE
MNPSRRWIVLANLLVGFILMVIVDSLVGWVMELSGATELNFQLIGDRFTLSTLVGVLAGGFIALYLTRNQRVSTLSSEVVLELKKVTWPTAQETRGATVVVIITVFIMAIFLGAFDLFWSSVMDWLYPNIQSI